MKGKLFLTLTSLVMVFALVGCADTKSSTSTTVSNTTQESTTGSETIEVTESSQSSTEMTTTDSTSAEKVFSIEELSKYNGKDGMSAYVAYKGVVYDVSDVEPWKNGDHYNGLEAGIDATNEISKSPHGDKVFKELPIVGALE